MWKRIEEDEHEELPRKWKHKKSGKTVRVEKYENGTWDTFLEECLIENFDKREEAIERGNEIVN